MIELLTVREVAARLKVSTRQVFKLTRSRQLPPPVKVGGSTRWRSTDIVEFIQKGCPVLEPAEART